MSEQIIEDLWTPYKKLQSIIEKCTTTPPTKNSIQELDVVLRQHKQNFTSLLKNPPKNDASRNQLKAWLSDGKNIPGHGHILLSKDLADETIIISDMFDLDEFISLEMLCTAQQQMPQHPGLPRGLVAVLLYYDGRRALACSLRDLFGSKMGVTWHVDLSKEMSYMITSFVENLVENSAVLERIIDLLSEFDFDNELALLMKNRALGQAKHYRHVHDLFEDIRLALATSLFYWSAQSGLPKLVTGKLINYFSKYKPLEASGGMDKVNTTLLMSLLYALDTNALQRYEDGDRRVQSLPIICEAGYTQYILDLLSSNENWQWDNKLKSVIKFAFGLSLACLRQSPIFLQQNSFRLINSDEQLVDESISLKVFEFLHHYLLYCEIIFKTEYFYQRVHHMYTDFIYLMHAKVTELRGKADETARTVQFYEQQGLKPPDNLDNNFENLMLGIGRLYKKDTKLNLMLCLEYWGPMEVPTNYSKTTLRSVSLFKFIRLAGDLLPTNLFVPYLKMLYGLSSCEKASRNTFNLLKQGSGLPGSTTISWDHFFGTLARYYTNLRKEQCPVTDTIYRNKSLNRVINPIEVEGLAAVLSIIKVVARHDENGRIALCEHPNWAPIQVLLGLLGCSVPIMLKAEIILTLSALAKSKETAAQIWISLENSQIISTIPSTNSYNSEASLSEEIETNESRNGLYPVSKAILELLYTLTSTCVPKTLGGGTRPPGMDPYVTFIVNTIFLKFISRNYENESEKWEIGGKCLKILYCFLKNYEMHPDDFSRTREDNPPPGYHIMVQVQTKSEILKLILEIIYQAKSQLDTYDRYIIGKKYLEECSLYCLQIIELALSNQDLFFDAHSVGNCSILLSGLNKIIFDVNPSTGQPDHVLNITKFVTYNSWIPKHSLYAVKILKFVCRQPNITSHILGIFTYNEKTQVEIRHGFVECLEMDIPMNNIRKSSQGLELNVELELKIAIIELLMDFLNLPAPNLAHYLLGFNITKAMPLTQMQKPGVLDFPSTCAKSLIFLLDLNIDLKKTHHDLDSRYEEFVEKVYELLYRLSFNQRTSEVILRFLRTSNDFLLRHLKSLPFINSESSNVLNQMSYLLKICSIELKILAGKGQVSRFQLLCELLLGVSNNVIQEIPLELGHYYENPLNELSGNSGIRSSSDQNAKLLICYLLECINFEMNILNLPKLSFFDSEKIIKLFQMCEIEKSQSPKLVNVKKLHEILHDELNIVQSTIAAGQRIAILQEIDNLLKFALNNNEQKNRNFATIKFMEAWGEITEILFGVTPRNALLVDMKQELILEVLQVMLSKLVSCEISTELSNISSGTVLMLLVNLRLCYNQSSSSTSDSDEVTNECLAKNEISKNIGFFHCRPTISSAKSNTLSLKYILKNITEWIIVSGVTSQKLRINLYASLLNFLHLIKGSFKDFEKEISDEMFVSRLDRSTCLSKVEESDNSNKVQMAVEVLTSFGDKLVEILCHDCISGQDICKMLSLACIDSLLHLDSMTNFITFISKRGYLAHLIDSLYKSDGKLCEILMSFPKNMKALYVYESLMAMFSRIASTHIGAELLVENKLFGVLSSMKVYDLHPDFQISQQKCFALEEDFFVPTVDKRFQQILFPALNICDVILSTLGVANRSAVSQIINCLISHSDMIEIVLRAGTPYMNLGMLQELSAITGLIARTNTQDLSFLNELNNMEISAHIHRLQKLMLALIPRFIVSESTIDEITISKKITDVSSEVEVGFHIKYFLEIASNLMLYCRNAVANHSADHRCANIIFSPSINESLQRTDRAGGSIEMYPSLGLVVSLLKNTVEYHNKQKLNYDHLLRKKTTMSNNSLDLTVRNNYEDICERILKKHEEICQCVLITEQCLYLLWTHLDFFMKRSIPLSKLNKNSSSNILDCK
ncbi:NUP205 family protein [Megaselia abdita]